MMPSLYWPVVAIELLVMSTAPVEPIHIPYENSPAVLIASLVIVVLPDAPTMLIACELAPVVVIAPLWITLSPPLRSYQMPYESEPAVVIAPLVMIELPVMLAM